MGYQHEARPGASSDEELLLVPLPTPTREQLLALPLGVNIVLIEIIEEPNSSSGLSQEINLGIVSEEMKQNFIDMIDENPYAFEDSFIFHTKPNLALKPF